MMITNDFFFFNLPLDMMLKSQFHKYKILPPGHGRDILQHSGLPGEKNTTSFGTVSDAKLLYNTNFSLEQL